MLYTYKVQKIIVFLIVVIFLSGCSWFAPQKKIRVKKPIDEKKVVTVVILKDTFNPDQLTIKVVDKVVFFNQDEKVHQISIGDKGGIPLEKGKSWTFSFEKPGVYEIKDVLNPKIGGKVVVK